MTNIYSIYHLVNTKTNPGNVFVDRFENEDDDDDENNFLKS